MTCTFAEATQFWMARYVAEFLIGFGVVVIVILVSFALVWWGNRK